MEGSFNSLMERWPGVLFRQRLDLSFESAGAHIEEFAGYPVAEWLGRPGLILGILHELDVEEFQRHLQISAQSPEGGSMTFRLRHARTGRVVYVSEFRRACRTASGGLAGYEGFWIDVTRQTLSERRLATAAWKETLGLVTLGLAHDFNNVLAGILGLSESFLTEVPPGHPFHEGLQLMRRSALQAAQMIQRIAQLHQGKTGTRSYQNLNELISGSVELLRKVIPKRIEIASSLEAASLPLYVDAVEFEQALIGLALNAADAMPERGRLMLRTSLHETLPGMKNPVGVTPRAPVACLEVEDNGRGIKPGILPFLFDPFFTTKPMNRGSGLGLYNARLFAEKHQGSISVESVEGAGATFRVWLPLADFTEAERAMELSGRRRRSLLLAGNAGQQRDSTAEFLRQNNYQVVAGGENAEDLLRSGDYQFDGVMLLTEPEDARPISLARFVRQQKLPLKVIVKTVGCNPDALAPQLHSRSDLVISAEMPEDAILDQLAATFALKLES